MIYEQEGLEKVFSILKTPKDHRTEEDLRLLWPLVAHIPAIQAIHRELQPDILRNLVFQRVEREAVGQEMRLEEGDIVVLLEGRGKALGLRSAGRGNEKEEGNREEVGSVQPGDYLMKEDRGGHAITALQSCTTMTLCCLASEVLLAKQHQSYLLSIQDKLLFLRSLPLFSGWSKSLLSKLSAHLQVRNYRKGQVIYRETDPAREVFFLVEGEVIISKAFGVLVDTKELIKLQSRSPKRETLASPLKYEGKVCIKQAKELFGDEEDPGTGLRTATSTCISPKAQCYSISKAEFTRKVGNPATLAFLTQRKKLEKEWVKSRLASLYNAERLKLQSLLEIAQEKDISRDKFSSGVVAFRHKNTSSTPKPKAIWKEESRSRSIFLTADTSATATPELRIGEAEGNKRERRVSTLSPLRDMSPERYGKAVGGMESPGIGGKRGKEGEVPISPAQCCSPFLRPRRLSLRQRISPLKF